MSHIVRPLYFDSVISLSAVIETPPRNNAAKSASSKFQFSPEMMKKATETASVPANPRALFVVTPPLQNGTIIIGVMLLFEKFSEASSSNKQFWGAKASVLYSIFSTFAEHVPGFADLTDLVSTMEPTQVLQNRYGSDQDNRVHRKGQSAKYYESAIGFVVNAKGKVQDASVLLESHVNKIDQIFRDSNFKLLYKSIIEGTQPNFANAVNNDPNFYKVFSKFAGLVDESPLNKILPDEDIIKLVASFSGELDPQLWNEEVQKACWKDGRLPRK